MATGVSGTPRARRTSQRAPTAAAKAKPLPAASRKRSRAEISTVEVAAVTSVTGKPKPRMLKPSDYCKNKACRGKDGHRRRKQAGFQGYCATCGPRFQPALVASVKAKVKAAGISLAAVHIPAPWVGRTCPQPYTLPFVALSVHPAAICDKRAYG